MVQQFEWVLEIKTLLIPQTFSVYRKHFFRDASSVARHWSPCNDEGPQSPVEALTIILTGRSIAQSSRPNF
jgi:hypothetical protein